MRKKYSKYDSAGLTVLFSVLFFFLSATMVYGWKLDYKEKDSLKSIYGVVSEIKQTNKPKAGRKIHIYMTNKAGKYHLTQNDLTYLFPQLLDISVGDSITALVADDCCGRGLEWFWEIRRGSEMIISYSDTLKVLKDSAKRDYSIGMSIFYVACLLLIVGFFLRLKFGRWSS